VVLLRLTEVHKLSLEILLKASACLNQMGCGKSKVTRQNILFVGLKGCGKTMLFDHLSRKYAVVGSEKEGCQDSNGANQSCDVDFLDFGRDEKHRMLWGQEMTLLELSAEAKHRHLWEQHYATATAIFFVFDSSDTATFHKASKLLHGMLEHPALQGKALCIICNKVKEIQSDTSPKYNHYGDLIVTPKQVEPSPERVLSENPQLDHFTGSSASYDLRATTHNTDSSDAQKDKIGKQSKHRESSTDHVKGTVSHFSHVEDVLDLDKIRGRPWNITQAGAGQEIPLNLKKVLEWILQMTRLTTGGHSQADATRSTEPFTAARLATADDADDMIVAVESYAVVSSVSTPRNADFGADNSAAAKPRDSAAETVRPGSYLGS